MGIKYKSLSRQDLERLIRLSIDLLKQDPRTLYTQQTISDKLRALGYEVSPSFLSGVVNGKGGTKKYLTKTSDGLAILLQDELGASYEMVDGEFVLRQDKDWTPSPVAPDPGATTKSVKFYSKGRRTLTEKTEFIKSARKEVIFSGLRLRQFAGYFTNRRDEEFVEHIQRLLSEGVDVKCYVADPNSSRTWVYFEALAELEDEQEGLVELTKSIESLLKVEAQLNGENYPGKLSLLAYRHLPFAHYLSVDGGERDGRLLVSHYLPGQPNAKVPVIEVWRRSDPKLYDMYWQTLVAITKNARQLGEHI